MSGRLVPALEIEEAIEQLGIPYRAKTAYRTLLGRGYLVLPAVQKGLRHPNAAVRKYCCNLLDHLVTPEALCDLLEMLSDPDPGVRISALHALACDKCKEGCWRPTAEDILPQALRLLRCDNDRHVRAMAVEVVGLFVHSHPQALQTLEEAHAHDPNSMVRKKAGWYVPGGSIYARTAPRPVRKMPTL